MQPAHPIRPLEDVLDARRNLGVWFGRGSSGPQELDQSLWGVLCCNVTPDLGHPPSIGVDVADDLGQGVVRDNLTDEAFVELK